MADDPKKDLPSGARNQGNSKTRDKDQGDPRRAERFVRGAGWQMSVDKCHDYLEVRVGHRNGPLIQWPDRGEGGRFTWSWRDPQGEVRDISPWLGDADQVYIWAKVYQDGSTDDHQCDMNTLYAGQRRQRWEFDEEEDHDVHKSREERR